MSGEKEQVDKVTVLGGGSFGTALATLAARAHPSASVVILLRSETDRDSINNNHKNPSYMTEFTLLDNITASTNPEEALKGANFIIHAVPAQSTREVLGALAQYIPNDVPIICSSKGIELSSLKSMCEVIPEALGHDAQPVAFFSGPTFARLLMAQDITAVVVAAKDKKLAKRVQNVLATSHVRTYCSTDVLGVEYGGALKNVIAIAAGMVEGLGFGANATAALVTRGCSELRRLAVALGADPNTVGGLSGIGDLMLTCYGGQSRNRTVGVRLGKGESMEDITNSMAEVAEGVPTTEGACTLAERKGVDVPIMYAVRDVIKGLKTPQQAVRALMELPLREED